MKRNMCMSSHIPRKVRISHNLSVPETTNIGLNHLHSTHDNLTLTNELRLVPLSPLDVTLCPDHPVMSPPHHLWQLPFILILCSFGVNQKWMSEVWIDRRHGSHKSNKLLSACFTEIIISTGWTEGKLNLLKNVICGDKTRYLVFYLRLSVNSVLFLSLKSSQQLRIYFR